MHQDNFRHKTEQLLSLADIKIGGDRPWDLQVHNDKLYVRLFAEGSLGFGESYMDGWWDCERLDEFFHRIFRARLDEKVKPWRQFFGFLKAKLFNLQKPSRSFEVGQRHYDIGNTLYQNMLGKHLVYSCAYWKNASTLDEAQKAKLELICRKLDLKPGMRVLDIGCGWGATAGFIAKRYDVNVVGVTISKEQARFGQKLCQGLPVEIRLQDYRSIEGEFDRILSIGMFEHVGYKNYPTFMRCVHSHLKKDGIFLLHTIGTNVSVSKADPWLERYIFPNSMLPSKKQICDAAEDLFVLEDWHNFGTDYDKTLLSWFKNFHENWDKIKKNYDERFYRMWTYYLLACAGTFRARVNQVWQIVLSPEGIKGGYRAPR